MVENAIQARKLAKPEQLFLITSAENAVKVVSHRQKFDQQTSSGFVLT